jgi:tetratricopeptide (TPR) repeat protein
MKTILIILVLGLTAAVVGKTIANRKQVPPPMLALPENKPVANQEPSQIAPPPPISHALSTPPDAKPDPVVVAVANAIDRLTSPQASLDEKQALWDQLRKAGELDDTIAGLKQLAADHPGDATIPTALGEAEIAKLRSVLESGGDQNEVGILGMQADQDFSQALKIDPGNWEAQFDKASSLAHWPLELNRGPEVIQRLSSLVTQQETMPPKPEFAQTYILLGQQYQAAGQADQAVHAWQQGAAKFPFDPTLQKNLAHAAAQ